MIAPEKVVYSGRVIAELMAGSRDDETRHNRLVSLSGVPVDELLVITLSTAVSRLALT